MSANFDSKDDFKKPSLFGNKSKLGKGLGSAQYIPKESGSGSSDDTINISSDGSEEHITCGEELFMDLCDQWIISNGDRILEKVLSHQNKKKPVLKK